MAHLRRGSAIEAIMAIVAVMVVVAAVVYPVLGKSRRGQQAQCITNIRLIGAGMLQYGADFDEHFPSSAHAAPGSNWGPQIYPYVNRVHAYHCNLDETIAPRPQKWPQGAALCPTHVYSYALNSNLPGADVVRDGERLRKPAVNHATLTSASRTVMFFEVRDAVGRIVPAERPIKSESPTGNTTNNPLLAHIPGGHPGQSFPDGINPDYKILHATYATGNVGGRVLNGGAGSTTRHTAGAVYVAADGHAMIVSPEQVSGGADAVDASCDQGTTSQVGPCEKQAKPNAAGTGHGKYKLTFSSK